MTLPRLCLPLALLAFGSAAAPTGAAPVPLLNAPNAHEVALAGTDVIAARTVARGGVLVVEEQRVGASRARLVSPGSAPRTVPWPGESS
jgi:hypothetical protein